LAACAPMRPKVSGLERLLDHVAQGRLGILGDGIGDGDLVRRLLVLLVGHDGPAAERVVFARLAVDLDAHVDLVLEALLGRRRERHLERENTVSFATFFSRDSASTRRRRSLLIA
jgi:hypothetical protein